MLLATAGPVTPPTTPPTTPPAGPPTAPPETAPTPTPLTSHPSSSRRRGLARPSPLRLNFERQPGRTRQLRPMEALVLADPAAAPPSPLRQGHRARARISRRSPRHLRRPELPCPIRPHRRTDQCLTGRLTPLGAPNLWICGRVLQRHGKEFSNELNTEPWRELRRNDGRPIGIGFQEQVSNQSELLRSKAVVVNVGSKVPGWTWGRWVSGSERKQTLDDASITIRAVKTRGGPHLWDQSAGSLMTGRAATGV